MSDSPPEIPEELHILAGEYVLGVLDAAELRAVRRRALQDAALAAAITLWERRLAPLAGVVPPAAPPPALWQRLERAIAEVPDDATLGGAADNVTPLRPRAADARPPEPRGSEPRGSEPRGSEPRALPVLRPAADTIAPLVPRQRSAAARARRPVWPWQLATLAALAVAAGVAAVAFVPSLALRLHLAPAAPEVAALIPADTTMPAFLAEAKSDGSVTLTALSPVTVPSGHDLELWILRPGASVPASLGVLPPTGRSVTLAGLPPAGTQLMVSLEPPGGSPTGLPTGPVLFKGALAQMSL